jgi:hypothetical protein
MYLSTQVPVTLFLVQSVHIVIHCMYHTIGTISSTGAYTVHVYIHILVVHCNVSIDTSTGKTTSSSGASVSMSSNTVNHVKHCPVLCL